MTSNNFTHHIPVNEIPKLLPTFNGKSISRRTAWRWCLVGVRGVVLETILIGGRRWTSEQAISAFIEQLSSKPRSVRRKPELRVSPRYRQAEAERASRRAAELLGLDPDQQ